MSEQPYVKFYPAKFKGGVAYMTREEIGAYIMLLCDQAISGHVPPDIFDEATRRKNGKVMERVKNKFKIDSEGNYYNSVMEEQIDAYKKWVEIKKNNGLKGGRGNTKVKAIANLEQSYSLSDSEAIAGTTSSSCSMTGSVGSNTPITIRQIKGLWALAVKECGGKAGTITKEEAQTAIEWLAINDHIKIDGLQADMVAFLNHHKVGYRKLDDGCNQIKPSLSNFCKHYGMIGQDTSQIQCENEDNETYATDEQIRMAYGEDPI